MLTIGMSKVAAYRAEDGALKTCSAVCPHMKVGFPAAMLMLILQAIVKWNHAEKTWDCPCHGARYDCMGKELEGPALADLEDLAIDVSAKDTEKA